MISREHFTAAFQAGSIHGLTYGLPLGFILGAVVCGVAIFVAGAFQ